MRLLLDTHALIWWWKDDPLLGQSAADAMRSQGNAIFVSAATAWEIATKVRSGRLPEMVDRIAHFGAAVIADGFRNLAVAPEHGVLGGSLRGSHKDPFDRLIAAQALIEDLTVVTRDPAIASFGCKVLW